jgi:uncharacterized protein YuzE
MTITYDRTIDAASLTKREGEYRATLPFHIEGVDLNIDIDPQGYVLGLEVLGASLFFDLVDRYGGKLTLPEQIVNPDTFDVMGLFSRLDARRDEPN